MSEYREFLTAKYREEVLRLKDSEDRIKERRRESFQQFIFSCIYENNSNIIKFVEDGEYVYKDRKSYFILNSQRGSLDEVKEILTNLGCKFIRDFSKPPKTSNPFLYLSWLWFSLRSGCMFDISVLKDTAPHSILEPKADGYDAL